MPVSTEPPTVGVAEVSGSTMNLKWNVLGWRSLLIAALILVLYYKILGKLVSDWWNIPDFSHGFLVPLFALYLLWDKRKELIAEEHHPTWSGIVLVAGAVLTCIAGVFGVELFLSRISLIMLLAGLVLTFAGWGLLKKVSFILLVLMLAIPIPAIILNQITFPLQLLASRFAADVLPLVGVPALRDGNVIRLPSMTLEVAEACSGIRSLMSLFTLAVFYGYFLERTFLRRTVLVAASVPIAVATNVARIIGTGLCVQYWDPEKAQGFFHEFSGWVMFMISLGCLYLVHRSMRLCSRKGQQ